MTTMNRRAFMEMAGALSATAVWKRCPASQSKAAWRERRDLYPEGVASADPDSNSVLLWTRRAPIDGPPAEHLTVELADDASFERVVATTQARVSTASDWTARVLVGGLKPANVYWYRFTDGNGQGSRVGRALTTPGGHHPRTV